MTWRTVLGFLGGIAAGAASAQSAQTSVLAPAAPAAQTAFPVAGTHPCGASHVHDRAMHEWPSYAMGMARLAAPRAPAAGTEASRGLFSCVDSTDVPEIPVVFHVVHVGSPYGTNENISDEQLESAVVALNEDFRKLAGTNGDGAGVDTGMSFVKAKRTPEGLPTSGIVRINGSSVPGYAEDGIALTPLDPGADEFEVKSLSAWPAEDYVNVWVVSEISGNNAQNGIQGFAYLAPTGNVADGIVILHNAIGTVGNLKPGTELNRTFTHEMGHHFSLYHTFHNTLSCGTETNCASQGDKVCDTPATLSNNACYTPECPGALTDNYMDYSPSWCRSMFTQGQADRMQASLWTERSSLLCSLGGVPPMDHDLGVEWVFTEGDQTSCGASLSPTLRVSNLGLNAAEGWSVTAWLDSVELSTSTSPSALAPGEDVVISFGEQPLTTGVHALAASLNWSLDGWPDNDVANTDIDHLPLAQWTFTLTTDFFASETSWSFSDPAGDMLFQGAPSSAGVQTFSQDLCLAPGCYTLALNDAGGDGMRFGGWYAVVTDQGEEVLYREESLNDHFGASVTHELCIDPPLVLGCTYASALNFNPDAGDDDGSCVFPCFGDSNADGFVGVGDLLNMLVLVGQECQE